MKNKSVFEKDVLEGLSKELKYLPSKYFYDDEGSPFFQKIMQLGKDYQSSLKIETSDFLIEVGK